MERRITAALAATLLGCTALTGCANENPATETGSGPAHSTTARPDHRVQLDPDKNYGNDYQDGVLPVGDGKYVTTGARKGYVYACATYAQSLGQGGGGAQVRGPWFSADGKTYDLDQKIAVSGNVEWPADSSIVAKGRKRIVTTNDLPEHHTGTFPVQATDPAYNYDRNPNSIREQHVQLTLKRNPKYGAPQCMGGQVGVMTTGAELYSAFDAGGRDAGAWEVQDGCEGHPQPQGAYHYHTLSSCIHHASVHTVIGWALDGFPITGPVVGKNNLLTTKDLDKCHGITSTVQVDGKQVTTYHYVMTQDFPYSVGCYRATPVSIGP
jgi:hypothetical protein